MLIVEDGSIVPDANSYIDREFYIAYAASRGIVVVDDDTADVDVVKAMDYLETQRFIGEVVASGLPTLYSDVTIAPLAQSLAWPRMGIYPFDYFPDAVRVIPVNLKRCQAQVALDIHGGFDPLPKIAAQTALTVSEQIGPLKETFAISGRVIPLMPLAYGLLRGLLLAGFTTYRA